MFSSDIVGFFKVLILLIAPISLCCQVTEGTLLDQWQDTKSIDVNFLSGNYILKIIGPQKTTNKIITILK